MDDGGGLTSFLQGESPSDCRYHSIGPLGPNVAVGGVLPSGPPDNPSAVWDTGPPSVASHALSRTSSPSRSPPLVSPNVFQPTQQQTAENAFGSTSAGNTIDADRRESCSSQAKVPLLSSSMGDLLVDMDRCFRAVDTLTSTVAILGRRLDVLHNVVEQLIPRGFSEVSRFLDEGWNDAAAGAANPRPLSTSTHLQAIVKRTAHPSQSSKDVAANPPCSHSVLGSLTQASGLQSFGCCGASGVDFCLIPCAASQAVQSVSASRGPSNALTGDRFCEGGALVQSSGKSGCLSSSKADSDKVKHALGLFLLKPHRDTFDDQCLWDIPMPLLLNECLKLDNWEGALAGFQLTFHHMERSMPNAQSFLRGLASSTEFLVLEKLACERFTPNGISYFQLRALCVLSEVVARKVAPHLPSRPGMDMTKFFSSIFGFRPLHCDELCRILFNHYSVVPLSGLLKRFTRVDAMQFHQLCWDVLFEAVGQHIDKLVLSDLGPALSVVDHFALKLGQCEAADRARLIRMRGLRRLSLADLAQYNLIRDWCRLHLDGKTGRPALPFCESVLSSLALSPGNKKLLAQISQEMINRMGRATYASYMGTSKFRVFVSDVPGVEVVGDSAIWKNPAPDTVPINFFSRFSSQNSGTGASQASPSREATSVNPPLSVKGGIVAAVEMKCVTPENSSSLSVTSSAITLLHDNLAPGFVAKQTGASDINAMPSAKVIQGVVDNVGRREPEVASTAHSCLIPWSLTHVVDLPYSPSTTADGLLHIPGPPQSAVPPGASAPGDEANGNEHKNNLFGAEGWTVPVEDNSIESRGPDFAPGAELKPLVLALSSGCRPTYLLYPQALQEHLRKFGSLVNLLTAENYSVRGAELKDAVSALLSEAKSRPEQVICGVFTIAVEQPTRCSLFADFFYLLCVKHCKDPDEVRQLCGILLKRCQDRFEEGISHVPEDTSSIQDLALCESVTNSELRFQRRSLGNVLLVAQLFRRKMIDENTMRNLICQMLSDSRPSSASFAVEAVSMLFIIAGDMVDLPPCRAICDNYIERLQRLTEAQSDPRLLRLSSCVMELRKNCWDPRDAASARAAAGLWGLPLPDVS
eukprot:RCo050082